MQTTQLTPGAEFMLAADPVVYKNWAELRDEKGKQAFVADIVAEAKEIDGADIDPEDIREHLDLGAARLYVSDRRPGIVARWKAAGEEERESMLKTIVNMAKIVAGFRLDPDATRKVLGEGTLSN